MAQSFDEVGPLAAAGADFVAVGDFIWSDPRGAAAALADARRQLRAGGCGMSAPSLRRFARRDRRRAHGVCRGGAGQAAGRLAPTPPNACRLLRTPPSPTSPTARIQRGMYLTAFAEATQRVEEKSDVKAMTLLAELYADGLASEQDEQKAADWYRIAAERGDREAMFALAMFKMTGRGGPRDRDGAAKLLAAAAKLGHAAAAYNLALLYLEGQLFPQDFKRAAELLRIAAQAGSPEAQYALATFYKEGRGVPKDLREAARLLAPPRSPTTPTPRSNTASRCSTAPASPRTKPPPPAI